MLFSVPPLPELEETWWGPKGDVDTAIRPFKINISEEVRKKLVGENKVFVGVVVFMEVCLPEEVFAVGINAASINSKDILNLVKR